jgi:hypothetical protein
LTQSLVKRAKAVKSRVVVRAWEYRQRNLAKGIWHQLRRLLAHSSDAYALTESSARELLAEGHRAEPVGGRLEPPKVLLFASPERLARIADKNPIPVRLGVDFLSARYVALVRFEDETDSPGAS